MSQSIVKWSCVFRKCRDEHPDWINWAYADEIEKKINDGLICQMCGIGALANKSTSVSRDGWLGGICEFPDETKRLPVGEPSSGWKDGSAEGPKGSFSTYTRENYIQTYHVDPLRYWHFIHPNRKRPADLIPQPMPKGDAEDLVDNGDEVVEEPRYPPDLVWANNQIDAALKKAKELKNNDRLNAKQYLNMVRYLENTRKSRNEDMITDEMLKENLLDMWKINGIDN